MEVTSEVTGRVYEKENTISIYNPVQAAKFIKHGSIIIDIKLDNDKICFIFDRFEIQPLMDKWRRFELV